MKSRVFFCLLAGAVAFAPLRAQTQPPSLFRSIPSTDPNRDPNWDFWTNRSYTFYYQKDGQIKSMLPPYDRLPYFITNHPTSSNDLANPDVFPEDGWMLVIRDFGTPTQAPALSLLRPLQQVPRHPALLLLEYMGPGQFPIRHLGPVLQSFPGCLSQRPNDLPG